MLTLQNFTQKCLVGLLGQWILYRQNLGSVKYPLKTSILVRDQAKLSK